MSPTTTKFCHCKCFKALEIFESQHGCERNISSCLSVLGASYVDVGHFEQAEESYNKALDILQKLNEESLQLYVRGNLGHLYASQNLSEEAIRHLTQVVERSHLTTKLYSYLLKNMKN